MGAYQIIFLDKIPKSAAVNESVNLAKRYGHKSSSNFVNAILRKVGKQDYEGFFDIENDIERISKITSMPPWIIEDLMEENTKGKVEKICKASNIRPEISIRVNKLKNSKDDLKKMLIEKNIRIEEGVIEDFLILNKIKNLENLDLFKEGRFTIQDEAAGLIPVILEPKEGEKILDACSAPGGKTTYLAELVNNNANIDAWDIHEHRVKLIEESANRLNITCIDAKKEDATKYNEKNKEKYDKILLDVPCLGIGVLKRKPDIKWQRKKEDIEDITKTQKQILYNCSKYLKKDGKLVYSTCSILKEENIEIIQEFLKENKGFKIEKIELNDENYFKKFLKKDGTLQVYQNKKTDGFFIAKIVRK
jgi:16S rRNA (cytosine967-C5)-methyltransferase